MFEDVDKHQKFLASVAPFKGLAPAELRALAYGVREMVFGKGETIFMEGDAADSVWLLRQGRVQVLKFTGEGKSFALESLGPGDLFGTLCRLGDNGRRYPCTAVAAGPVAAYRIPDRLFFDLYFKSPGLARGLCALCTERLRDSQNLRREGQEPVNVRLAAALLRLARVHGETIPFTKREVAELIGATLETTFRALARLQEDGALVSTPGKIRLKNVERLKALVKRRDVAAL